MSFPRYSTYKDSGVEWLGQVPEHWEVKRLGTVFRQVDEAGEDHLPILCVSIHDGVSDKELGEEEMDRKVTRSDDRSKYKKVEPGELVYNMMRAWQGGFGAVSVHGMVSPAYVVARPKSGLLTSIIEQQLRTPNAVEEMRRYSQGVTDFRLRLYWEEFKCISVVIPPTAEQREIAEFLEGETRKINGLVSEQRRLMELLREKRQAVISHAVTRGLNPAAPLKPSGIEWLGDVPTHWEVKRIKFVTAGVKAGPFGSALTKDVYVSAGFRVYGQEQVSPNDFTLGDYFITPEKYEELSQYSVSPGDILISCVGTFGKIAIVPGEIVPGIINPRLIRLRCSKAIKAEYLVEVMRSNVTFEQLSSFTRGGTMDVINIGTLSGIFLALPPMPEQEELLTFMSQESSKFDALKAEAQRAIDLLLERRTALISAAVTGQIDVCAMAN